MNNKVTYGLIGVGSISQNQHLPNLSRAKRIHLKTICDIRQDVLGEMREKYAIPESTTDYRQLLADPDIEAVVIATKPDSHIDIAVESLNAGKHVYVEKPLAETVEECQRVIESRDQANKMLVVGFNRRMSPAYQDVRSIAARHGGLRNVHYRLSDAFHIWGKFQVPGTRVIHELCHIFDILRYLCDSEVNSVYCVCSRPDDESLILTFESGCVASIMSSGYVEYDMPKESLEVILERGAVMVTDFVELRTFGLDDCEQRICYPGHTHPDKDTIHRYLFEKAGANCMLDLRRLHYEGYCKIIKPLGEGELPTKDTDFARDYIEHFPRINYMMDKGWLQSHEHFARSILSLEECQLATPEDGLQAALIAEAAIKSRENGKVVRLAGNSRID